MITRNAHALRPSEANGISTELYGETVGIYHIVKPEEYDEYAERCRNSSSAGIKSEYIFCHVSQRMTYHDLLDWFKQKQPWFIGTINQKFTKMPPESWRIIPSSTNLNETSHAATNAATGIQLTLLDAIKS